MLPPRLLLFRPARGGLINKKKLEERFADFARGERLSLLEASRRCAEMAAAHTIVQLVSSARQALEGADLAPGNDATMRALCRRPSRPQEPIASALVHLIP